MPQLEAIYIIQPIKESLELFMNDFDGSSPKYRAAHLFFTETCSNELFKMLADSSAARYVRTLREINVAFLPYERQVFTLNYKDTFRMFYGKSANRTAYLDRIAEQLATVCVTLNEYPSVRYRR